MKRMLLAALLSCSVAPAALAADPDSCRAVTFSDVGWTDIQATTGVTMVLLDAIGYEPELQVLSVPVTYASLKNKDVDVFLGNWMPSMAADVQPYLDDGSVETIAQNLSGAGYGIVVPKYVADAGVALPREDTRRHRQTLSREVLHHGVDQVALLHGVVLQRPEQPLADHQVDGRLATRQVTPELEQGASLRVRARVGAHEHHARHPRRMPQRQLLRHHSAHERAQHVGAIDAERVEQPGQGVGQVPRGEFVLDGLAPAHARMVEDQRGPML